MKTRNITLNDREEYLSMANDFFCSDAVSHSIPQEYSINTFNEAINGSPFIRVLIIEQDGEIAGFSHISFSWSSEVGGLVVIIEDLYIKSIFRSKGIGRAFFNEIFEEYKNKAMRFRLEVAKNNARARALYEDLGFEYLEYLQMVKEKK